jgi:hypothetical protein
MITEDEEFVSFTLACEELAAKDSDGVGPKGLKFMLRQAARKLRESRPDLSFVEHPNGERKDGKC